MFNNIGKKIKGLAIISSIIGWIVSLVGAIYCWANDYVFIGFVVLIMGCLLSWLSSFLLYGFGELIIQTTNIARENQNTQKLTVSNMSNETVKEPRKNTVKIKADEIKDEAVEVCECDKYGYVDESDGTSVPKNDECPCCFRKININDEECWYCGYKLK